MAHTSSAEKRIRQANKQHAHNASRRSMMRTSLKKMRSALTCQSFEEAAERFKKVQALLDRLAVQGLIHKNKAARHKSIFHLRMKELEKKSSV